MQAIEIHGLSKTYRSKGRTLAAVKQLDLNVPAGQVLAFLGPNGAGKTTTIKMICGLITPTSGQICLNGFDVGRQPRQAKAQISAVLEGTRNIYWRISTLENVLYFGRLRGFSGKPLRERAGRLLQDLNLWDRRNDDPGNFSRGMQQKLAIACALVTDPPIVLLDEPTLGLDVQAAKTVEEWVVKLAHEQGKTVVITTHQLDMAQKISDRVAIINRGELIADQPTHELLRAPQKEYYEIKVGGHYDRAQLRCPDSFTVALENGHTVLTGPVPTPDMLYDLLHTFSAQSLPLLSVTKVEPNLEEVFIELCGFEVPAP